MSKENMETVKDIVENAELRTAEIQTLLESAQHNFTEETDKAVDHLVGIAIEFLHDTNQELLKATELLYEKKSA